MLLRIYLIISVFGSGLLFAQTKISNSDRETIGAVQQKGESKPANTANSSIGGVSGGASEKALLQKLTNLEKEITTKVSELEKLQSQAVEFNKNLAKEMFIINENASSPTSSHQKYLTSHHVEYTFEGGNKIKEVRVVSRHKSLTNDINSIVKVISFVPGNLDSIKVTIDKLDTRVNGVSEVENYKDFAPEVKLHALKAIDTTLLTTIYRLDSFIQRSQITKNEKNKNQLEGL